MKVTQTSSGGQTHVEPFPSIPCYLSKKHKITKKKKLKLNSLEHLRLALRNATTAKTLAMSGPTASNSLDVCGSLVALTIHTKSTPTCCNCTLVEGEKPHPGSYRGCRHEKGKLQRRIAQRAPKGSSGKTFFSKFTSPQQ
jgi:hypothetical protein